MNGNTAFAAIVASIAFAIAGSSAFSHYADALKADATARVEIAKEAATTERAKLAAGCQK